MFARSTVQAPEGQINRSASSHFARSRKTRELADALSDEAKRPWPNLQPKLRIGHGNDPLERQADAAAEAVVAGKQLPPLSVHRPATLSPKCAQCEDEKIQSKSAAATARSNSVERSVGRARQVVSRQGRSLPSETCSFFETRFGHDFSRIRVHTDSEAALAARDIGARAYTLGSDIAFAAGEFAPQTAEGRKLIAHELAHTIQQAPFIARQTAPYYTQTFEDRSGGGKTNFTETVQVAPSQTPSGITGTVDRSEIAPASGAQPSQTISSGQVRNIRFDPGCTVTVPYRIAFQQQTTAQAPFCQEPPSTTPVGMLSAAQMQKIQTEYVGALNAGLNDQYAVRVEGCQQPQPCAGKSIPIKIDASAVTSGQDRTINVVNRGGRGNAGTICAGAFDAAFATHEGGHQVLGMGDEYHEGDPTLRQKNPTWTRDERVRTDVSRMGEETQYGRFAMFHERHFRFAQVFLEAVYRGQGCKISLEPVRAPPVEARIDLGIGGARTTAGGALAATLDAGVGVPLERNRRLSLLLQAHAGLLIPATPTEQLAFQFGARIGLEAKTSPGRFGVTGMAFGTAGGSYDTGIVSHIAPYAEAGGGLGVQSGLMSGVNWRLGAEAAAGREFSNDPHALKWVRVGVAAGLSF